MKLEDTYRRKKVLVTGDTGFKGSWLVLWLLEMGAEVVGISKDTTSDPSHYSLLGLKYPSEREDVRNLAGIERVMARHEPEIVFHLAAQSLVKKSYAEPLTTFSENVLGTATVLEAVRSCPSVRAVVCVTSDKCYSNNGEGKPFVEDDPLGGDDPYSASKACSEIVVESYRKSFFSGCGDQLHTHPLIASVRSGNVIGGGDWADDRLIPDLIRAWQRRSKVGIRNPRYVRPWLHVLDSVCGYLLLGAQLSSGDSSFCRAWNFSPEETDVLTVDDVVNLFVRHIPELQLEYLDTSPTFAEAPVLRLNSSLARTKLGWHPLWSAAEAVERTAKWYHDFVFDGRTKSTLNLREYIASARAAQLPWA